MKLVATFGLALVLVACAAIDLRERRLPDWLTLPLVASGLVLGALDGWSGAVSSLAGAVLGYLAFYLASKAYLRVRHQEGLGLGDAKLLAAAGAWLGPFYLAPVVLIAAVLALALIQGLRVAGRAVGWQTTLPFGPFLSAGFFACWCAKLGGWPWGA